MKNAFLISLIILFSNTLSAQQYLTDDASCIDRYLALSEAAFDKGEMEEYAAYMYDSVKVCLVGRTIKNTVLKTVDGQLIHTDSIQENILLIFSASWCKPCVANIPAINMLAQQANQLKIILMYWDDQAKVEEISSKYADGVVLVPSLVTNEVEMDMTYGNIFHQLGYPTSYAINPQNEIVDLFTGAVVPGEYGNGISISEKEALQKNYDRLVELLSQIK